MQYRISGKMKRHAWLGLATIVITCLTLVVSVSTRFASENTEQDSRITDSDIVRVIERELLVARGVSANAIDVASARGVVTLSGSVTNILAKERAIRIAKTIKGVRSVIDRLIVHSTGQSDGQIRKNVIQALAVDPATESWEITVSVKEGVVTLTGTVDSYSQRQLAAKVAKGVKGVRNLSNEIDIKYRADVAERSDKAIKAEIEQRLQWDVRVDEPLIIVGVNNGNVTLRGVVGSAYERSIAFSDAWVSGVQAVDISDLKVRWWKRDEMQAQRGWDDVTDAQIRKAVQDAFIYDPRVSSFTVDVYVENGIVTLQGTVDNLKAKKAAAQDAKNTVGVWSVRNLIKVRPTWDRSDDTIRQDIQDALLHDPYVNRYEITVSVLDKEVHLYGTVDSHFEKAQAGDIAARVKGVVDVHNQLLVGYDIPPFAYPDLYDWDPTLYDFDFDYETTRIKQDWEIRRDIESEIWWSPFVNADAVTVHVEYGVATLTGTVDSWSERTAATQNALEGGAIKVINRLKVKHGPAS